MLSHKVGITMKYKNLTMMKTTELINQFTTERGNTYTTEHAYLQSVRIFERFTNTNMARLIYLAEIEQDQSIVWKKQSLRQYLIEFRIYLYDTYKQRTAKQHLSRVIAVFRHFEITIEKLPYFSTKHAEPSIPINPDLMIGREVLKLCINIKNPLLKAITLFMSSTGMSKIDTLDLTIKSFIDATYEYTHTKYLPNALNILKDKNDVIGYWENHKRSKTGEVYYTFSSNESTTAIVQYLLTREKITLESPLFDISYKYLGDLFKETNDKLHLGKNGQHSRFSCHMLRRYHATQLVEAGMDTEKINILQGRKPKSIAYQSYIKIKPSRMREEYIQALPYLVVEDYNRVKTELELTKDELEEATIKNNELENSINGLWDEINNIKERQNIWNELKGD